MKIVEIKKDKKHTVKVSFDDGKAFNFDIDYWNSTCLRENDQLDDAALKRHLAESDYLRAKARGLWFLDRSDYSEKTLYQKIVAGGISGTAAAILPPRDSLIFTVSPTLFNLSRNATSSCLFGSGSSSRHGNAP